MSETVTIGTYTDGLVNYFRFPDFLVPAVVNTIECSVHFGYILEY